MILDPNITGKNFGRNINKNKISSSNSSVSSLGDSGSAGSNLAGYM